MKISNLVFITLLTISNVFANNNSINVQEMLHEAILNNSVKEIKKAVQAGADINFSVDNKVALLWGTLLNKINAVEELLNSGADINIIYADQTLAQHAVKLGYLELACILVQHGSSCLGYEEEINQYLYKELSNAIYADSPERIRRAIKLGADIHFTNQYEKANKQSRKRFYEKQLKKFDDEHEKCCKYGNLRGKKAKQILEKKELYINKNSQKEECFYKQFQPILIALMKKKIKALEELIKQGVDINAIYPYFSDINSRPTEMLPPLFIALDSNDIDSTLSLIRNGACLDIKREAFPCQSRCTVLSSFISRCNSYSNEKVIEFIEELIDHGYNINDDDMYNNALFLTFLYCRGFRSGRFIDMLSFLLKNGADLNKVVDARKFYKEDLSYPWTFSPLHSSILTQSLEIVKFLLDNGANVNQMACPVAPNLPNLNFDKNITPLFYAVSIGNKSIIDLLISHGASL